MWDMHCICRFVYTDVFKMADLSKENMATEPPSFVTGDIVTDASPAFVTTEMATEGSTVEVEGTDPSAFEVKEIEATEASAFEAKVNMAIEPSEFDAEENMTPTEPAASDGNENMSIEPSAFESQQEMSTEPADLGTKENASTEPSALEPKENGDTEPSVFMATEHSAFDSCNIAPVEDGQLRDEKGLVALTLAEEFAVVPDDIARNMNVLDETGQTYVHKAAGMSARLLTKLLALRPDVNIEDEDGYTPLMTACKAGLVDCVNALVRYDRQMVTYSSGRAAGATALHVAAQFGHTPVCRALIESGAPVDAVNGRGETPLMLAAMKWVRDSDGVYTYYPPSVCALRELRRCGADPGQRDSRGRTPLHHLVFEPPLPPRCKPVYMGHNVVPCVRELLQDHGLADVTCYEGLTFRQMVEAGKAPYHKELKQLLDEFPGNNLLSESA